MKAPWTRTATLPGGDFPAGDRDAWFTQLSGRYGGLPATLLRALSGRYGTAALALLDDAKSLTDLGEAFGAGLTAREIDYLVANEWARTADDVLWRRTKCGLPMTAEQRQRVAAYLERT